MRHVEKLQRICLPGQFGTIWRKKPLPNKNSGYIRDDIAGTCVRSAEECAVQCPSNSAISSRASSCSSCVCDEGFWYNYRGEELCIPKETACANPDWDGASGYACPPNSTPQSTLPSCPWSIWDCDCNDNRRRDLATGTCVPLAECSYQCPPNMRVNTSNGVCPVDVSDCFCMIGFKPAGNTNEACVSEDQETCWSDFSCPPENSSPRASTNNCPWSIWDCECNEGLKPDPATASCVPDVPKCWSEFTCPDNSSPLASSNNCPWSIWDVSIG